MRNLLIYLFFVSFFGLVVGLIRPSSFDNILKRKMTREKILVVFGAASLIFFVLIGLASRS